MEVATIGKHAVSYCPACGELLVVRNVDAVSSIEAIAGEMGKHVAANRACDDYMESLPTLTELAEKLRPHFAEAESRRVAEVAANPNNGRLGYWIVSGVRNEARTLASSAQEAIDKCLAFGAVGDWESPAAEFWTEQLPDVF